MAETLNWNVAVERFIAGYANAHTRFTYRVAIRAFIRWTEQHDIDPTTLTSDQVALYAAHCTKKQKPNSARHYISVVTTLYKNLYKRGYTAIKPFIAIKLPAPPFVAPKHPPLSAMEKRPLTDTDIACAIECAPYHIAVVIRMIVATGIKTREFTTMTITDDGGYISTYKDKEISGRMPVERVDDVRRALAHITRTIDGSQRTHKQITTTLNEGIICAFEAAGVRQSASDLRRHFTLELYKASGHDIEAVRRALHHKDVSTTVRYLRMIALDIQRYLTKQQQIVAAILKEETPSPPAVD